MMDALRQASEALSEALSEGELLFGEGLGLEEPLKSALSAAMSAESPQTTLSTFQMQSMPSRSTSSRSSSEAQSTPMQAPQLFSNKMAESLPQHFGIQRKSISIPIQRKDFVPPHLMSIQETSMDVMDTTPLSSSYSAGFRPGSVTQGKGRKLSGFDAVRFRNAIMRQTGFIEADTRDR